MVLEERKEGVGVQKKTNGILDRRIMLEALSTELSIMEKMGLVCKMG